MGGGEPWVWSAADLVDPLTGLEPIDQLRAALGAAFTDGRRLPLVLVIAELPGARHPVEHARRLTLAGAMAWSAFGSALAVGRLGVRRVGVLCGRDAELLSRADLLARMVHDLPATVRLVPLTGSPEVADWALRRLGDSP